MNKKGIVQISFLILLAAVFIGAALITNENSSFFSLPITKNISLSPSPSTMPLITATPTPTPAPTPSPTVTSTAKPSPSTPAPVSGPPGAGYSSITVGTEKGNFSATIMSFNLGTTKVVTDSANDSDCSDNCPVLPLGDYVLKNGGFAGVNGTYFCPETYPECAGKKNSFDFPVYNSRLGKWINQGNLFWNGRAIVYFDGGGAHYLQNANSFGGGISAGIVNHPGLIDGGNVQIDNNQTGLSDKQRSVGTKVGIGVISPEKVIVVVAYKVNMQQFAYVFKALGTLGALNLDTGGSTALYYNGYKLGPGRNLPNAIVFANK